MPQTEFVIDSSVILSWYFADEADAYGNAVAVRLAKTQAVVPSLWPLEIANALVMGERRKRSTVAQATTFLSQLAGLPIVLDDATANHAWGATLQLARAHQRSVYDAAYLELALRRGLPLATLDQPLQQAAAAIGIARYAP
jgi:predicted nucleic acid-binding protein